MTEAEARAVEMAIRGFTGCNGQAGQAAIGDAWYVWAQGLVGLPLKLHSAAEARQWLHDHVSPLVPV